MGLKYEEVYELAKHLHDASILMKKMDEAHAKILIDMASNVLDMIDNTRFTKEESAEIDQIVEELADE
jgi:hypothetical protein